MRKNTFCTILDAFFRIVKGTTTIPTQSIKGTITKKAIEILRVFDAMARKILAVCILKKAFVIFFHNPLLVESDHSLLKGLGIKIDPLLLNGILENSIPIQILQG